MNDALAYAYDIGRSRPIAYFRYLSVNSRLTGSNQFLHFPPGAQPCLRQQLMQFLGCGQHRTRVAINPGFCRS
jgi:hypothetical protein